MKNMMKAAAVAGTAFAGLLGSSMDVKVQDNVIKVEFAQAFAQACTGRGCPNPDPVEPGRCTNCQPGTPGTHNHGGRATSNATGGNTNIDVKAAIAPNQALSSGWCMEGLSGSVGVYGFSGGLAGAKFAEACGRWYTMAQGATNVNCPVGMTSVLVAAGKRIDDALEKAVAVCYGPAPRGPRNRGG